MHVHVCWCEAQKPTDWCHGLFRSGLIKLWIVIDYNHGAFIRIYKQGYKKGAVAPNRTWGPFIFISKFKFL